MLTPCNIRSWIPSVGLFAIARWDDTFKWAARRFHFADSKRNWCVRLCLNCRIILISSLGLLNSSRITIITIGQNFLAYLQNTGWLWLLLELLATRKEQPQRGLPSNFAPVFKTNYQKFSS